MKIINPNHNCINTHGIKDVDVLKVVDLAEYGDIKISLMYGDITENTYIHINNSRTQSSVMVKESDMMDFLGVQEQ